MQDDEHDSISKKRISDQSSLEESERKRRKTDEIQQPPTSDDPLTSDVLGQVSIAYDSGTWKHRGMFFPGKNVELSHWRQKRR